MFDIRFFSTQAAEKTGCAAPGIAPEKDGSAIVAIWRHLLEQGLPPNASLQIAGWHLGIPDHRWDYTGGLLTLVTCVLCGRGTLLRRLCLPMVEILLAHGVAVSGAVDLPEEMDGLYVEVGVRGPLRMYDFPARFAPLPMLQQMQQTGYDPVDAAVVDLLEKALQGAQA